DSFDFDETSKELPEADRALSGVGGFSEAEVVFESISLHYKNLPPKATLEKCCQKPEKMMP
ncbi:hypothetical protein PIB30_115727, partial [Stylosanthes scabra]|nr:hypothetical protein [Stylosanthes scabra]